jgi:flagellar hook protein FlgE
VGGKNIDSLSRDQFGRPQFNTKVTIDASGGPGSTWGKTANGGVVQFTLDSTDLTGYSSAAQTYANEQDGTPTSQLSSYSFDTYGKLVAQYDNGKSVVKGQLILATVATQAARNSRRADGALSKFWAVPFKEMNSKER